MYTYAISFSAREVISEQWQKALDHAQIRKIEYSPDGNDFDLFRNSVKALAALQAAGRVEVASIHIPFSPFEFWTLASPDENERCAGVKRIRDFLAICRDLNCRNFTIHGSGEPVALEPEARQQTINAIRRTLTELSEEMSQINASLNVEMLPRSCIGNTPEELLKVTDGLPDSIGICCDVNHLCGAPKRVPEAIAMFARRIRTLHLSDYDGINECHWFPGLGVLDWSAIMREVRKIPHDLLLIFEVSRMQAPAWQQRTIAPEIHFHNCASAAKMLDAIVTTETDFDGF